MKLSRAHREKSFIEYCYDFLLYVVESIGWDLQRIKNDDDAYIAYARYFYGLSRKQTLAVMRVYEKYLDEVDDLDENTVVTETAKLLALGIRIKAKDIYTWWGYRKKEINLSSGGVAMGQLQSQEQANIEEQVDILETYDNTILNCKEDKKSHHIGITVADFTIGETLSLVKPIVKERNLKWSKYVKKHYEFTVKYADELIAVYERFSPEKCELEFAFSEMSTTCLRKLLVLTDEEISDFFEQREDAMTLSSSKLVNAIKEYKGESGNSSSHSDDSGKDATPAEKPKMYTEKQVENRIKVARMKFHSDLEKTVERQDEEITQLTIENQRLRDENRVLNERGGPLTFNAVLNALCIDGTHIGNIVNYHTGEITRENMSEVFNEYVDNLAEKKKQEELDKLNALGVTG